MKAAVQSKKTRRKERRTANENDPPFLTALLKLSKPRDWPADFALNHAHYAKGFPKKA